MTTRTISNTNKGVSLAGLKWLQIGLMAAAVAIPAVLLVQFAILARWPELAAFKPLESYPRSALFTLIPALVATAVFAWLVKTQERPVTKFLWVAGVVLLLSFIPDFALPVPNRSIEGGLAAAFLHVVAALLTVGVILSGYRSALRKK